MFRMLSDPRPGPLTPVKKRSNTRPPPCDHGPRLSPRPQEDIGPPTRHYHSYPRPQGQERASPEAGDGSTGVRREYWTHDKAKYTSTPGAGCRPGPSNTHPDPMGRVTTYTPNMNSYLTPSRNPYARPSDTPRFIV